MVFSSPEASNAMDGLARGILSMQRNDGAFRTYFPSSSNDVANHSNNDVTKGIEFYSGEAMTALLDAYVHSKGEGKDD